MTVENGSRPSPARTEATRDFQPEPKPTGHSCPDCGVVALESRFVHREGCRIGWDVKRAHATDEAWFTVHTDERTRVRPIAEGEAVELVARFGELPRANVRVVNWGVGPLVRWLTTAKCTPEPPPRRPRRWGWTR